MRTVDLGELLQRGRPNSLNLVRLVLAGAVLVSHAWPLGGFGASPALGGLDLGTWAVGGFFAVSGFLVPASRARLTPSAFVRARLLRLLPALWVCLLLTAFVAAPLVARSAGESWRPASAASYVLHNLALRDGQATIGSTLTQVPYALAWNGSLWTLKFEGAAYLALLVLLVAPVRRRLRLTTPALLVAALVAQAWAAQHVTTGLYLDAVRLATYFTAGMLLFAWRDRVRTSWSLTALAVLALVAASLVGGLGPVAPLVWAYVVLSAGVLVPARWAQRHDVSYGVYLYAFPVQQVLAAAGVPALGVVAFLGASALGVAGLAWASWLLVERPALRLSDILNITYDS